MPTINRLADHFAESFGIEASRSNGIARYLREAGMLSQGARGVNAPNATALDGARLLIGNMLVWVSAKSIPDHVKNVGNWVLMEVENEPKCPVPTLDRFLAMMLEQLAALDVENPAGDISTFFCIIPGGNCATLECSRWNDELEDWEVTNQFTFVDELNKEMLSDATKPFHSRIPALNGPFGLRPTATILDLFPLAKVICGEKQVGWRLP